MSDSHIITPLCVAEDPLLYPSCLLAENPLGSISEHTEHNLVKHFLSLRHVIVGIVWIVVILSAATFSKKYSHVRCSLEYLVQLSVESDLGRSVLFKEDNQKSSSAYLDALGLEIPLPSIVKVRGLGKDDHRG